MAVLYQYYLITHQMVRPELNSATGNPATTYIEARDNMFKIGNSHAEA